jgi:hypothetical protein
MQAHILRIPKGHYILHCPLVQANGIPLPESWTHLELALDHLRILCPLPEHPRPDEFEIRDPRLSSWLRARIHSGKLSVDSPVYLHDLFEGVYRVESQSAADAIAPVEARIETSNTTQQRQAKLSPKNWPVPVIDTPLKAKPTRLLLPARVARRTARPASIAVQAAS